MPARPIKPITVRRDVRERRSTNYLLGLTPSNAASETSSFPGGEPCSQRQRRPPPPPPPPPAPRGRPRGFPVIGGFALTREKLSILRLCPARGAANHRRAPHRSTRRG